MSSAAAVQAPVSLKTLSVQVNVGQTTVHIQLRNLTPIGGIMEVTNTGEKKLVTGVSARLETENKCIRTLAAGHLSLDPGDTVELSLGIMMPGCVSIFVGDTHETATEIVRLPSPGGAC